MKKFISIILVVVILMSNAIYFPTYNVNAEEQVSQINLALNKAVTSSSSYETPNEGWCNAFLVDGLIPSTGNAMGWTTFPTANPDNPNKEDWVMVNLDGNYSINQVKLYPRCAKGEEGYYFPVDYQIQVSNDGSNFTTVNTTTGAINVGAAPQVVQFEDVNTSYVRLLCTKQTNNGSGNYMVQIMEMAVFGTQEDRIDISKSAIRMNTGEKEKLSVIYISQDTPSLTWTSGNDSVATVTQDGLVTAVGQGSTDVTVTDVTTGTILTCKVEIVTSRIHDKFMINAFWPPSKEFTTDAQYKLMAEAYINVVQNCSATDTANYDDTMLMAQLADKYGMQVIAAESTYDDLYKWSNEKITETIQKFIHVPGIGGIYLRDEPLNGNPFARAYLAILDAAPYADIHYNFLPMYVYKSDKEYQAQMSDFAQLIGTERLGYLMYDMYPFGLSEGSFNEAAMFQNLDAVRETGLKNDVKTAFYVQSIGVENAYRRPNGDEIRYEVSAALAYGFKQLSYFTWMQPVGRGEAFTPAIVDAAGVPTGIYESVKLINKGVTNLGPTLMKLDAISVYHSGTQNVGTDVIPNDFFFKTQNNDDVILSYMRDKTDGTNYVMAVNRNLTEAKDITFVPNENINSVMEISKEDGTASEINKVADGTITVRFLPGECRLFKMPGNFDYTPNYNKFEIPAVGSNVALDKNVSGSYSFGSDGYYFSYLTDGMKFSTLQYQGWDSGEGSADNQNANVIVDLKQNTQINRVDLYPAGGESNCGEFFPQDFTIEVSTDKVNWTTVSTHTNVEQPLKQVPVYKFDTVNARYIKINITKMRCCYDKYCVQLSEIETYLDDGTGTVTAPPATPYKPEAFVTGMNLALNKKAMVSSTVEAAVWGWASIYLTDGLAGSKAKAHNANGWTSQTGLHTEQQDAREWVAVKLGNTYYVDHIVVAPRGDEFAGKAFPEDYNVDVSMDGVNWTTVKTVTGDTVISGDARKITFEPVQANYVRFTGTKLTLTNNAAEGYVMQLSEFEVYGNPELVNIQNVVPSFKATKPITIDGVLNESDWKLDQNMIQKEGESDNTAKVGLMWDDKYLYAAFDVTDAKVINSKSDPYNDDSVEIYIDGDLNKGAYTNHSVQYVFRVNDDTVYKFGNDASTTVEIEHKMEETDKGYTLEVAIPWSAIGGLTVAKGKKIGFTAHVNDRDASDGDTNGVIGLTDMSNGDWHDSSKWIETILVLQLKEATIAADNTGLKVGGSTSLSVSGKFTDGSTGLTGAKIEYFTDKSDLISFENGRANALAAGTANIWSQVTLNGVTVESNKVAIKITDNIVKGEKSKNIILDGNLNEAEWSKNTTAISKLLDGTSKTISADFSTVWDKDNLYVGLSVTDSTGIKTDFSKDNMTIYVAPKNFRGNPYSADDFQIQIFDEGARIVKGAEGVGKNDTFDTSKVNVSSKFTNEGYVMEISIPWSEIGVIPQAGMEMGFDLMTFDGDDEGAILVWSGDGNNWISTLGYGVLTLTEDSVASIKEINVTTEAGKAPSLPDKVTVVLGNGTEAAIAVKWNEISPDKYAKAGTNFVVEGTVEGTDIKAKANVTVDVAFITSIEDSAVTTTAGTAPSMPEKVTVVYSDGTKAAKAVKWDTIESQKYAQGGTTFTVEGTVESTGIRAKANVTVNKVTIPSTPSGQQGSSNNTNTNTNTTISGSVISVKPTVNNGTAVAEVSAEQLEKAFGSAAKDGKGNIIAKIQVAAIQGAKEYVQRLPTAALQSLESSKMLEIETPISTVVLPSNALKSVNIQHKIVEIYIGNADKTALSEELRKQIGDKPVVEIYFKADGKLVEWNNPDAPATVSLNYKPTAEELKNPEHLAVWYIDSNSKIVAVPNGRYDVKTGKVIFTTTHFSEYAVAFVNKTFSDIDKFGWAKKQIEVLASKGIIDGTKETTFSPEMSITRGDYLTLLMKTLGLTTDVDSNFEDVKPNAYYYNAVGTAKKLGITAGTGKNKFNPKAYISRQDMIVLTDNALKIAKKTSENGTAADLNRFTDKSQIAQYAAASIADFVKAGLIHGSNDEINPRDNTSRAEAAVLLYAIYNADNAK